MDNETLIVKLTDYCKAIGLQPAWTGDETEEEMLAALEAFKAEYQSRQ